MYFYNLDITNITNITNIINTIYNVPIFISLFVC